MERGVNRPTGLIGQRWAASLLRKALRLGYAALLGFALIGTAQAAIPASERAVLLNLYNSTHGANWTNKTRWNDAEGTECFWYGVGCDGAENHVTYVILGQNNLTGSLPSLSGLTALQHLGGGEAFVQDFKFAASGLPLPRSSNLVVRLLNSAGSNLAICLVNRAVLPVTFTKLFH